MKESRLRTCIFLFCTLLLFTNCETDKSADAVPGFEGDPVEKPIYDYIEGWYDQDPEKMEDGLHPALRKRSINPSEPNGIRSVDLNSLLSIVLEYGGQHSDERRIDIEILDVQDNIATAKLISNEYIDYLHLVFIDNKWKIINALWEFIGESPLELTPELITSLEKPAKDYVEGWYDKDASRLAESLHLDLAKRNLNPTEPNGIQEYTYSTLLADLPIYGGLNGDDRRLDIEILDVQNNIATLKVTSNSFYDYLHLCYIDNQWLILNVLWKFQ